MSRRADRTSTPWQIKRITSITGPVGTNMSAAIQNSTSVMGQTEVLWIYQEDRKRRMIEDTSSKVSSIPVSVDIEKYLFFDFFRSSSNI